MNIVYKRKGPGASRPVLQDHRQEDNADEGLLALFPLFPCLNYGEEDFFEINLLTRPLYNI